MSRAPLSNPSLSTYPGSYGGSGGVPSGGLFGFLQGAFRLTLYKCHEPHSLIPNGPFIPAATAAPAAYPPVASSAFCRAHSA